MAKFLEGDGIQPIASNAHDLHDIRSMTCPYIYDGTATVVVIGASDKAYVNIRLSDDGKIALYSIHNLHEDRSMAVAMPRSVYLSVARALVSGLNSRNLSAFAALISPSWVQSGFWPDDWKQKFLETASRTGTISSDITQIESGADDVTYKLIGDKGACTATITLDGSGHMYTCVLHDAPIEGNVNLTKNPSEIDPVATYLVAAINGVNVDELEALFNSDFAQQFPPNRALPLIGRIHDVAGLLSVPKFVGYQTAV